MAKLKYKYPRIDMTARISADLYGILDEMSYNLKVTKNDLIISALLLCYDTAKQCPDNEIINTPF